MKNIVSRESFLSARYAVLKLAPALAALEKIDFQTVGYDDTVFAKIQELHALLDGIHAENQAVVDQGNEQFESRPIDLINKASTRFFEIPLLIEGETKSLENRLKSREEKAEELVNKAFTTEQIDKIVPPVPQEEIDASHARVAALKAEATAIEAFLADSPCYHAELLKDSPVYPWPVGE